MNEALDYCLNACRTTGRSRVVLTANASHILMTARDPEFREAYLGADLVTPDGMSVVWAARLLGFPLRERVTGVDMLDRLFEIGDQRGLRIFLLGAQEHV